MTRTMMPLKAGESVRFTAKRRIIFWEHGYLWVGNDDATNLECFGTLSRPAAVRMAKAILAWKPQRAARRSPKGGAHGE